jgi:hypothetical protein
MVWYRFLVVFRARFRPAQKELAGYCKLHDSHTLTLPVNVLPNQFASFTRWNVAIAVWRIEITFNADAGASSQ